MATVLVKEFNGDSPAKMRVLGQIDFAHASVPEFLENAVVRDGLPNHVAESYVCETRKSMKASQRGVAEVDLAAGMTDQTWSLNTLLE